jgi:hypothetical protein
MIALTTGRVLIAGALTALSAGLSAKAPDGPEAGARGSYEARLTGAVTGALRGTIDAGNPSGTQPGVFVITLGASGEDGAMVFSRRQTGRPGTGTYSVGGGSGEGGFTALVATGSMTRPLGAFRAEHGTLTITRSSPDGIAGRFELRARGFMAAEPEREDREIVARGSFSALPVELSMRQ